MVRANMDFNMRKLSFIPILFCAAHLGAQVPSQFSGLPTTTTDYTCAGVVPCSTLPMPTIPSPGGSYSDPTFGTTIYRMIAPPSRAIHTIGSEVQHWNSNGTRFFIMDSTDANRMDLYDATTYPLPPTYINQILASDGTYVSGESCDALWSNTNPNIIYYVPCFASIASGYGLQLRYIDVSSCTTGSCTLTPTTVQSFSCVSDANTSGYWHSGASYAAITGFSISGGTVTFTTPTYTTSATWSGSTNVVTVASATNLQLNQQFSATNVPSGTYILGISGLSVTLSQYTTGSGAGATVTLTQNTLQNGQKTYISGLSVGTYLNGQTLIVSNSTSAGFQASFSHTDVGATVDSGSAGTFGTQIESGGGGGGGLFDSTDNYFRFSCDYTGGGGQRDEIDLVSYEQSPSTTLAQTKWYNFCPGNTPTGCAGYFGTSYPGFSMYRMHQHPDYHYNALTWQNSANNNVWVRGTGTECVSPTLAFCGVMSAGDNHQDLGYDINGVPVAVQIGGNVASFQQDQRAIEVTDLTHISTTVVTTNLILLPCTYSWTGPGCESGTPLQARGAYAHISMNGSQISGAPAQGYALVSTLSLIGYAAPYNVDFPAGTTLGTAVSSPGSVTVTPGSMSQIGVGVVSTIDYGTANAESVTWASVTPTTATATFTKTHPSSAPVTCWSCGDTGWAANENDLVQIDTVAAAQAAAITGCSISGNTVLITTSSNTFTAGELTQLNGLSGNCSYLNGAVLTVSATGLSNSGFQAPFAHADSGHQSDSGTGTPFAKFWRVSRTMTNRDSYYYGEPHTTCNRDYTACTWEAGWNFDLGSSGPLSSVYEMFLPLTGSTPSYTLTVSTGVYMGPGITVK
jgi:hypothetical protein